MKRVLLTIVQLLYGSLLLFPQERLTLLFAGDLMQHQAQIESARRPDGSFDYRPCFAPVRSLIEEADIAIGNLEVTLAGRPYSGYPCFSAPDEFAAALREAGFDVLLTANNHCLDRSRRGLERTIRVLDSLHIAHLGTYQNRSSRSASYPLLIEKKGFRIVLLNATYGTNGFEVIPPNVVNYLHREELQADIRKAHAWHPDAIIACVHWGEEYRRHPSKEQRAWAEWLLQQGVTHIIGSHPHVVQPMELRTQGSRQHVVVYSLGNFISNMSREDADGGALFMLELQKPFASQLLPPLFPWDESLLRAEVPFPSPCRVSRCGYRLVWTARPALSGASHYSLYPVNSPAVGQLPAEARNRLDIFAKRSLELFRQYNLHVPAWQETDNSY